MKPLLSAKNLKKEFKTRETVEILKNVSLEIYPGESVAITGRSGEGKTTLLHILGTLEPFNSGELILDGNSFDSNSLPKFRNNRIGFIFQAFNLLEDFTALENVLMPSQIARKPFDQKKGMELLTLVGLKNRANLLAKKLSGGERQRVAIARALCNDPDILFADEPSGNLDTENAEAVSTLLFNLVQKHNKTLILVTHDLELASHCDRKFTLSQGSLLPLS
jgi:lipoprotein-releasing system ATP-binding protein